MQTNIKTVFQTITAQLQTIYDKNEAESIAFLLIEFLYKNSRTDVLVAKELINFDEKLLQSYISRLLQHEPIQYIIGKAFFYENDFIVNQHTLIPRSETEELVHLIIQENKFRNHLKIIDIGTGTGCIPITLFHNLIQADVYGIDIDKDTLEVAKKNARNLSANITWINQDILNTEIAWQSNFQVKLDVQSDLKFDIIVSNPPYVRELEKTAMQPNVLNYEPAKALFVSNENPLIFYEAIANFALKYLAKQGKLYFEINQYLGQETKQMLENKGFIEVEIIKDLHENDRICKAKIY